MKEHALVLFTLLAQAATGGFVIFQMIHPWIGQMAGQAVAHMLTERFLLLVGVLFGLSLLVSFFHLGNPLNAWRALANLRSSWLSREILFTLFFTGLWTSVVILEWRQDSSPFIQNIFAWLAAISGLALVYFMSRVYTLRTVRAWYSISTPLSFFVTCFILGGILVTLGLYIGFPSLPHLHGSGLGIEYHFTADLLRWIGLGGSCLLGADLLASSLRRNRLRYAPPASNKQKRLFVRLFTLRQSLNLAALACAGVLFVNPSWALSVPPKIAFAAGLALFLSLIVAEVLERALFYTTGLQRNL